MYTCTHCTLSLCTLVHTLNTGSLECVHLYTLWVLYRKLTLCAHPVHLVCVHLYMCTQYTVWYLCYCSPPIGFTFRLEGIIGYFKTGPLNLWEWWWVNILLLLLLMRKRCKENKKDDNCSKMNFLVILPLLFGSHVNWKLIYSSLNGSQSLSSSHVFRDVRTGYAQRNVRYFAGFDTIPWVILNFRLKNCQ